MARWIRSRAPHGMGHYRPSSTALRRLRREARRHARQIEAHLPEKAKVWRDRARNG